MPVTFENIPSNLRVPFWHAEVRPAPAPYQAQARHLLLGYKDAAGTAPEGQVTILADDAEGLAGKDSMLYQQAIAARRADPFGEIWLYPLPAPGGATAATATITVGAAATRNMTLAIYLASRRIPVILVNGDDANAIAGKIAAAINAACSCVTAAANLAVVTLTSQVPGSAGNGLLVDTSLRLDDDASFDGNLTVVQFAGGAGDPDIATALASLGDEEYDVISSGFSDTATLDAVAAFMDHVSGRWSPMSQLYGHYVTARDDTLAGQVAFGAARNDPHATIMAYSASVSPPWEWAAALGGRVRAQLTSEDTVSRPLQTLPLSGIYAPGKLVDRFTATERQSLYFAGMSAFTVDRSGQVILDRVVTTYQRNKWGSPDSSWLDIETLFQNMFVVRWFRAEITGAYPRAALADDNPGGVDFVVTPEDIRDKLIHAYRKLVNLGIVEDAPGFAAQMVVERDATDANRVNASLPIDVVNQLRVFAAAIISHLQFDQAA